MERPPRARVLRRPRSTDANRGRPGRWLAAATIAAAVAGSVLAVGGRPAEGAAQAVATPTLAPGGVVVDVSPPNYVRFGGISYAAAAALPEGTVLGPEVGRVEFQDQGPAALNLCGPGAPGDGSASFLEAGTPLHAVAGYATWFRIAAELNGRTTIFEAWCGDRAFVAADLLDIAGAVERVEVLGPDRAAPLATITDAAGVDRWVRLVLASPIDPALVDPPRGLEPHREFYLDFHLADGTVVVKEIRPFEDVLLMVPGIVLPAELGRAIDAVAGGGLAAAATPDA